MMFKTLTAAYLVIFFTLNGSKSKTVVVLDLESSNCTAKSCSTDNDNPPNHFHYACVAENISLNFTNNLIYFTGHLDQPTHNLLTSRGIQPVRLESCLVPNSYQTKSRKLDNARLLVRRMNDRGIGDFSILMSPDLAYKEYFDAILDEAKIESVRVSSFCIYVEENAGLIWNKLNATRSKTVVSIGVSKHAIKKDLVFFENMVLVMSETFEVFGSRSDSFKLYSDPCVDLSWMRQRESFCDDSNIRKIVQQRPTLSRLSDAKSKQMRSTTKRRLTLITKLSKPFVFKNDAGAVSGLLIEMIRVVCDRLNLRLRIRLVDDDWERVELEDTVRGGYWSHVISRYDVTGGSYVIAPVVHSPQLPDDDVIISAPFFQTEISYGKNDFSQSDSVNFNFLLPFTTGLWLALGGAAVALAFFLVIMSAFSPYGAYGRYIQSDEAELALMRRAVRRESLVSWRSSIQTQRLSLDGLGSRRRVSFQLMANYKGMNEDEIAEMRGSCKRQMSLSNAMYFTFAGLLWQSPESVPRALSSRIPASVWYMVGVIAVTCYTANLIAFVNDHNSEMSDFRNLINQRAVVGSLSYLQFFLYTSSHPLTERIIKSLSNDQVHKDDLKQSLGDGRVVFAENFLLQEENKKLGCTMDIIKTNLPMLYYAVALPKDFPYADDLLNKINGLSKSKVLEELRQKYSLQDSCSNQTEGNVYAPQPMSFGDTRGVFIMLLICVLVSMVIVVVEWIIVSLQSVDKSDPSKEFSFWESTMTRWRRMMKDARYNWFPCKCFPPNKVEPSAEDEVNCEGRIKANQWKRYKESRLSHELRPGFSLSHPQIDF